MTTTSPAGATSYKNLLQEHCQKIKAKLPLYNVVSGTPFRVTVSVMDHNFASEDGFSTKKQAEQNAAKVALQSLNILLPFSEDKTGSAVEAKEFSPASMPSAAVEGNMKLIVQPRSSGSTHPAATSPVSYKSLLQERAHKLGATLPVYDTQIRDGSFVCVVTFNGHSFDSDGVHKVKKQAEQSAASVALASLDLLSSPTATCRSQSMSLSCRPPCSTPTAVHTNTPPPMFNLTPQSITPETHKMAVEVSWKNLLQEHMQQCGMKLPVYATTHEGTGFVCSLQIGRDSLLTSVYPNKKQAEKMAAKQGLLFLGLNPEEMAKFKESTKQKRGQNQRGLCLPRAGERTSWIRPNWNRAEHFDSSWEEMDYFWEQSITKRRRVDTTAPDEQTWGLPAFDSRPHMSVGEIWKEKKNIVVVGNAHTSFVLYCTAVKERCQLFCEEAQSLVSLEPGHRIIGLDAQYLQLNGKIALDAARCVDIFYPPSPDPVLTSCGVVLLYQDPESRSDVQVLLKRYLVSQAFINVLATLAQYFRRKITGRPIKLDMMSSVEHIHEWMLQEVHHIAAMDEDALRKMFSHMWKFNEKWCIVLKPSLPKDLKELQARATEELARRQGSGVTHPEDFYRPWSLPKGNFKHRVLSTGWLIESPVECAVRELREETGIQLDTNEVQCLPFVDLPHVDNLNPHCGDIVRYYLYVYSPESMSDEEELNTTEDANSSVAWETRASQGEGMPTNTQGSETSPQNCTLAVNDLRSDQLQDDDMHGNAVALEHNSELAKEKVQGQGKSEKTEDEDAPLSDMSLSVAGPEDRESKACETEEQRRLGEQGAEVTKTILPIVGTVEYIDKSFTAQGAVCTASNMGAIDQERKGLKRKRDCDNEGDYTSGDCLVLREDLCPTPSGRQPGEYSDNTVTPTKSPHVHGGIHEECAWLPLNEARQKSPVFGQIYDTAQFFQLLASTRSPLPGASISHTSSVLSQRIRFSGYI